MNQAAPAAKNSPAGQARAAKPACANCAYFVAPPPPPAGFDLGHDINGKYRKGECRRFPAFVRHEVDDVCGEHPTRQRKNLT